jgi:hypothetical protein
VRPHLSLDSLHKPLLQGCHEKHRVSD